MSHLFGNVVHAFVGSVCCCTCLQAQDPFIQELSSRVIATIENASQVPGLNAEEFQTLKAGIKSRWYDLVENGSIETTAADQEVRPYFVALQAVIEHVLSKELGSNVHHLIGIIHTPMPATPLCTVGAVSQDLVDLSIVKDPHRAFTVQTRTTILRDYLYQGGDLYVVYPKNGLHQRTKTQQHIYLQELKNYPSHLFDRPLDCTSIDPELIGATYLFTDKAGKSFAFAIKMTQAISPQTLGNFGLWFGPVDHPAVAQRVAQVRDLIPDVIPILSP